MASKSPSLSDVFKKLKDSYSSGDSLLRIIDIFLLYIVLTGVIQFVYCALIGTFPFNSFLAGFISTVGLFILTVCLRMQVSSGNSSRAFADYCFCSLLLFVVAINFMG
eukprot:TRINITY_DN4007_c0_g1_i1.p1 TRINITY_DN4007_c0_g1~~TRINITY_DN4007_c0_g1_i1.p1  ORF type:complete len:119 (-),score=28.27 TRINITY_DN4007_c0_g1_i1:48-371(-)